MNQRLERVEGLHPLMKQPVLKLVELCEAKLRRQLLIVFAFRTVAEQLLRYQQGRTFNRETQAWYVTDERALVTRALPGASAHNVVTTAGAPASMAVDVVPLKLDGTPDWKVSREFWDRLYEVAWKAGLDPLGDPVGSYLAGDLGHFEEPAWKLKLDGLGCYQPVGQAVPGSAQI
jgi:hypothetical protein